MIDIVNAFVTDDRLYNALIELPEKANFVNAVTTLVTSNHLDLIRSELFADILAKLYILIEPLQAT